MMTSDEYRLYSIAFYKSKSWRQLRLVTISILGPTCLCCKKELLLDEDLQVDHVIPRINALHLELDITNLQILCAKCNGFEGKGTQTIDYRSSLQRMLLSKSTYVPLPFVYEPKPKRK